MHCSGGAQTKVLHFVDQVHVIKDNLFPCPQLFKLIQEQSKTDWKEMYKVFNMGNRMEVYCEPARAQELIQIAAKFNLDARVIGRVEAATERKLTIESEFGTYIYTQA